MSKSKWANLFTRSATDDEASNPRYDRRPSHASSCCSISTAVEDAWSDTECCTKKHKHGSNTRTRLIPSLFRRRGSNTSTSSSCSSFDTEEQETCERDMRQLKSLLDLALDEVKRVYYFTDFNELTRFDSLDQVCWGFTRLIVLCWGLCYRSRGDRSMRNYIYAIATTNYGSRHTILTSIRPSTKVNRFASQIRRFTFAWSTWCLTFLHQQNPPPFNYDIPCTYCSHCFPTPTLMCTLMQNQNHSSFF